MDGIHDMGGMHGFGPVRIRPVESGFRAAWEGRVVGMVGQILGRGLVNIDAFRHAIETLPPTDYLLHPYFARWRASLEKNLLRAGAITREELEARRRRVGLDADAARVEAPGRAAAAQPGESRQPGFVREIEAPPRFAPAQRVRARELHAPGHTRLPRYVRGRRGEIARVHAGFVFPDTNAHGRGESPQYLYSVQFDARELWGDEAEPGASLRIDLFESYLEGDAEEVA